MKLSLDAEKAPGTYTQNSVHQSSQSLLSVISSEMKRFAEIIRAISTCHGSYTQGNHVSVTLSTIFTARLIQLCFGFTLHLCG